ncbi:hypothetical protein MTY66_56680 [Mycolicibacterium sp. TY66]|jgi:hypothetical protein|uniref:hypothetical protein n=1 Tax=unclassified Mycolicibacterium TaxID=2636767 RepID=UPI001BB3F82B|nr:MULTISPECIES: hypothetical protein [unclassified Mycolicibacterium]BCI84043.1 hypothetical protein MTY66_56680 [Mycolicibacterium sp. TY66]BCJ84338.1 hypothetical protein MTY81_57110 [Mycolicibacterium sp. TY81]
MTVFRNRAVRRIARLVHSRTHLTPQERYNLQLSHTPLAVISASLGAHPNF